jgi:hypothetical protein
MNLAPGSITALSTATHHYKVRIERINGTSTEPLGNHPIIAWAVVTLPREEYDDQTTTVVDPVFLYEGKAYTPQQFVNDHGGMYKTEILRGAAS